MDQRARPPSRTFRLLISGISILLAAFLVAGCGRQLGHGVLLWSPDEEALPSGSVVPVLSESNLADTYTLWRPAGNDQIEIARWRVRYFPDAEGAAAFARAYSEVAGLYARAARNALPMRSAPELKTNNITYRLRQGEVIKIVDREDEPSNLSGLQSYWYTALTDTGVRAYVFGYELELFNPLDPQAVLEESGTEDPLLELLLGEVWRPVYYVDMIRSGAYDLNVFQPEYGLFPRPEERVLELVLPYHTINFEYGAMVQVGPRKYLAEGTNLQLTFNRGDELSIQYVVDGRQFILAMQRVPGNITEYVEAELERRRSVYENLMNRGPVFSSGSYGRISLLPDQRFEWTGFDRLVPAAIPAGSGSSGTVGLDLYLAATLTNDFDGALSFRFDGRTGRVSFVYALTPDGIRMVYVPESAVDNYLVPANGLSTITLFFSATGG